MTGQALDQQMDTDTRGTMVEESPARGGRWAWLVGGGLLAAVGFVVASGKADALLYVLHCALAS